MKKTIILCLFCFLLLFSTSLPVAASSPKIIDDAGLLTPEQVDLLEAKATALVDEYQMDVVIVTVWSLDGKSSEAYADDYFDYNGYGIGEEFSGILLLLSMEYRDWAISTCGETIYALTDYSIQSVFSQISSYLAADEYYNAFNCYLDALVPYFKSYKAGDPIDGYAGEYSGPGIYTPGASDDTVYYDELKYTPNWYGKKILTALLAGTVVATIALGIMRSQMNTARQQRGATSYMNSGSYNLKIQRDMFLYSNVRKVRRQESSSGGSRGGGSSVHRSNSGRSHGGGHGKF